MKKLTLLLATVIFTGFACTVDANTVVQNETAATTEQTFPYAVDLEQWPVTIEMDDNRTEEVNDRRFSRQLEESELEKQIPTSIDINLADLNPHGKGIYFTFAVDEALVFYPISIETVPTKEITVFDQTNESRTVQVNSEVTILENSDGEDSLELLGQNFYLFYNKDGGISLAISNGSDSTDMLEYLPETDN